MGIDSIIKISGTVIAGATSNGIASVDIPEDGEIVCIGGVLTGDYTGAPAPRANSTLRLVAELSFLSTNQIGANDARGAIAGLGVSMVELYGEAAETGGGGGKISEMASICFHEGIIINAGERIYIHGFSSIADLGASATFLLYIKSKGGGRRSTKRR